MDHRRTVSNGVPYYVMTNGSGVMDFDKTAPATAPRCVPESCFLKFLVNDYSLAVFKGLYFPEMAS